MKPRMTAPVRRGAQVFFRHGGSLSFEFESTPKRSGPDWQDLQKFCVYLGSLVLHIHEEGTPIQDDDTPSNNGDPSE
jgi:hypothetical protein